MARRHWWPVAGDTGRQKHPPVSLFKSFKFLFMRFIYLFSRVGCEDRCLCKEHLWWSVLSFNSAGPGMEIRSTGWVASDFTG